VASLILTIWSPTQRRPSRAAGLCLFKRCKRRGGVLRPSFRRLTHRKWQCRTPVHHA
jgi:hypothetical protein